MADDVDHRTIILVQHAGHVVQHRQEAAVEARLVGGEGHVRRHAQDQGVALTGHADAGAGQLGFEGALLTVHVLADACARQGADARADQCVLAALFAVRGVGQVTQQGAAQGAGDRARAGVVAIGGRTVGIGRGAGGCAEHGGDADAGDEELGAHGMSF
ncbi:hypothetical protein D3C81_1669190 [compost metagenome]